MRAPVFLLYCMMSLLFFGCSNAHDAPENKTSLTENNASIPAAETPVPAQEEQKKQDPNQIKVGDDAEISAFLSRATFGATEEDIRRVRELGSYEKWIDQQFSVAPSLHMEWVKKHARGINGVGDLRDNPQDWEKYSDALGDLQLDAWWDIVVHTEDQLRQRVAFALSEIFVISKYGPLITFPDARISYYDMLVENAFANFETLLEKVTYHPAMGKYLSYIGNARAGMIGAHPDENYAREVMQLFSIGLYLLNPDGSYKKDRKGNLLYTYTQKDVTEMAKVFTGLSDDNGEFPAEASFSLHKSRTRPMTAFDTYHERGEKNILGRRIPSGGTTKSDIQAALHILFMHPNTGTFIGKRLIQHLVTSNPSPDYIRRVTAAFNDNGKGVRGDMKAVIKAVLLDPEALHGKDIYPHTSGKFREPLLFVSHLFRAFHAQNGEHILSQEDERLYRYSSFNLHETGFTRQEGPLSALTVFNYFTPEDAPFSLKKQGLSAPELTLYGKQGIDDLLMGLIHKNGFVYELYDISAELQLEKLKAMMHKKAYTQAIDYLNTILCAGTLSDTSKKTILTYLTQQHKESDETLSRHLIGLVMTSPDYALQR